MRIWFWLLSVATIANIARIPNIPNIPSIPNIPNIPNVLNILNLSNLSNIFSWSRNLSHLARRCINDEVVVRQKGHPKNSLVRQQWHDFEEGGVGGGEVRSGNGNVGE